MASLLPELTSYLSSQDCARLAKLFILAISAALSSLSCLSKEPVPGMVLHKEQRGKESVFVKLLRWMTASVILGRISGKSPKINSQMSLNRTGLENLQSLLEAVEEEKDASREEDFRSNEALAAIILYIQQISGMNFSTISSVVSALCLLLLPSSSTAGTFFSFFLNLTRVLRCENYFTVALNL